MEKKYILTHDLGTSGNKGALFDLNLNLISQIKEDYPLEYPKPGWAEQNAENFWKAVKKTTQILIYYISQFHNIYECFSFLAKYRKYFNLSAFFVTIVKV